MAACLDVGIAHACMFRILLKKYLPLKFLKLIMLLHFFFPFLKWKGKSPCPDLHGSHSACMGRQGQPATSVVLCHPMHVFLRYLSTSKLFIRRLWTIAKIGVDVMKTSQIFRIWHLFLNLWMGKPHLCQHLPQLWKWGVWSSLTMTLMMLSWVSKTVQFGKYVDVECWYLSFRGLLRRLRVFIKSSVAVVFLSGM